MGHLTRSSAAEKGELIRIVEEASLPVKRTLAELDIPRSTFYRWYARYLEAGYAGLEDRSSQPKQFWNRIPESVRQQGVQIALAQPELSPRELACRITDTEEYFISESSVYRILKAFDLITSPAFILLKAADKFAHPTKRSMNCGKLTSPSSKSRAGVITISRPSLTTFPATFSPGNSVRAWPTPICRTPSTWRWRPAV